MSLYQQKEWASAHSYANKFLVSFAIVAPILGNCKGFFTNDNYSA